MNSSLKNIFQKITQLVLTTSFLLLSLTAIFQDAQAESANLRFQRPGTARQQSQQANKNFRRPSRENEVQAQPESRQAAAPVAARKKTPVKKRRVVVKRAPRQPVEVASASQAIERPKPTAKKRVVRRDRRVTVASDSPVVYVPEERVAESRVRGREPEMPLAFELASCNCEVSGGACSCDGPCMCEVSCGCPEPSCGMYEPGCGLAEPSCGCGEPSCGICEPSCGCGEVGCGTCCALPGPDYLCFPVCIPRFKDLSFFAGVQGFRGPRDFSNGRSDSNFGFNEGFNLSGRAPIVGLLFPQLSYQLGYRAVQTRLHGTATSVDDRSQQFVTAGFFRRVNTGLQFGAVWDLMQDDLDEDIDLHQIRYEISLKSPQGREIGFFGTNSTNDALSNGVLYETVDQYAMFYRWKFGNGYESRLWGGATGDGEGLFGGEFYAPLSSRWALQSSFNYLITDQTDGLAGVSEESWNIGINMVWHLGKTAKRGCKSPYRPMFSVADNGWMFVDQAP